MFWKKEKASDAIKDAVKDVSGIRANTSGSSRRALSMIPVAANGSTHEIAATNTVRFHHLLITLEGNQRTGCLKIISPGKKARSAMLIYRGRVVGCLYGRKNMSFQFLHEDAHQEALADLASPGNVLDAYQLPEELVLAAAALFHGQVLDVRSNISAIDDFNQAARSIEQSRLPGCIVVNNVAGELICMAYFCDGKMVGLFSASAGWMQVNYDTAVRYIHAQGAAKVMASLLPLNNKSDARGIGFSLTGLDDIAGRRWITPQVQAIDSFTPGSEVYSAASARSEACSAAVAKPAYSLVTPNTDIHSRLTGSAAHVRRTHQHARQVATARRTVFAITP